MTIIVARDGRVVGTGYNGSPPGHRHCDECPRWKNKSAPGSNYDDCFAVHSEANALMFSDRTVRAGGTLYVNGVPCYQCAKLIASSGLARVVCWDEDFVRHGAEAVGLLFEEIGIEFSVSEPDPEISLKSHDQVP